TVTSRTSSIMRSDRCASLACASSSLRARRPVVRFALAALAPREERIVHDHARTEHLVVVGEHLREAERDREEPGRLRRQVETRALTGNPLHGCPPPIMVLSVRPMTPAARMTSGSGAFLTLEMSRSVAPQSTQVGMSMSARLPSTNAAPAIAPV